MMDYATRYACRTCGATKFVPERPLSPTPWIRTGCGECERITVHSPVGSP